MDIDLDTPCPRCGKELGLRKIPGDIMVLTCSRCQVGAVAGDDRFSPEPAPFQEVLDAWLRKRAEKVADDAKRAAGRYTEVTR